MGIAAAGMAFLLAIWLVLALIAHVPTPDIHFLDQSGVRLLAELIVVNLLIAAVAFWEA